MEDCDNTIEIEIAQRPQWTDQERACHLEEAKEAGSARICKLEV